LVDTYNHFFQEEDEKEKGEKNQGRENEMRRRNELNSTAPQLMILDWHNVIIY
tara:strand:+ start:448 stop:606 length:159 start_codon:yes stop_codon:yes gene_type:complete